VAVDLPGRDNPEAAGRLDLDASVAAVVDTAQGLPRPLTLVGHSLGGVTVTQAAEALGDELEALVYVCAFVPGDGESVLDLAAERFEDSLALRHQVIDEALGVGWIDAPHRIETLYGECDLDVAAGAAARLVPDSLALNAAPVRVSDGQTWVRRTYVETLRDRAIPIAKQRDMATRARIDDVRTLDADHSPMQSRPGDLADILISVGAAEPQRATAGET
jgi:pimeloyl-ACP methyl ester carboxylesterase